MIVKLPIKGVGKGRPRFRSMGKYVSTYTPKKTRKYVSTYTPEKTREYEDNIRKLYIANGGKYFEDKLLNISIDFFFTPPASLSDKKKSELYGKWYGKTPDVDNLAKAVLDALNGENGAYKDDKQIVQLTITKKYSFENCIIIMIEEIKEK